MGYGVDDGARLRLEDDGRRLVTDDILIDIFSHFSPIIILLSRHCQSHNSLHHIIS